MTDKNDGGSSSTKNKSIDFQSYSIEPIVGLDIFKTNSRLLNKLKLDIEQNNFYEIHQLYKTIHFRGMNNNLINDCIELIFNGISYFAFKNNLHCCYDLSKVFIETLKRSDKITSNLNKNLINKIKCIHAALRLGPEERNEFSAAILKWSSNLFNQVNQSILLKTLNREKIDLYNCQKKFGHVDIHREFALNLWSEKNYVQARYHFLHSLDGESFAKMMIECHLNFGFPSEYDLFLVQAVLQYLFLRNISSARQFYDCYLKLHPNKNKRAIEEYPLINFANFLLQTVESGNAKTYQTLLKLYKPSLSRDESLNDYLDRIGQYYFNLKSKNTQERGGGNMFTNILKALTSPNSSSSNQNEYNDDDEDEQEDSDDENVYDNNYLD